MRRRSDDRAMLNLALRWAPYGKVPISEIWVTFGMSPARFHAFLKRILDTPASSELSPEQRRSLERLVQPGGQRLSSKDGIIAG